MRVCEFVFKEEQSVEKQWLLHAHSLSLAPTLSQIITHRHLSPGGIELLLRAPRLALLPRQSLMQQGQLLLQLNLLPRCSLRYMAGSSVSSVFSPTVILMVNS